MRVPLPGPDPRFQLLSEVGDCTVYQCGTGCLHVRVGDVTLRLNKTQWQELVGACTQAQALRGDGPVARVLPS
jgi:hypothetical protein